MHGKVLKTLVTSCNATYRFQNSVRRAEKVFQIYIVWIKEGYRRDLRSTKYGITV